MNWKLRKMENDDVDAVAGIEQICFSDPWSKNMVSDLLESSWDEVWILEEKEKGTVGYINFRFLAGEGELMRIAVLPGMRGQGLSRTLMDQMMESAAKHAVTDITLEVRAGNEPAIGLYQSYGFVGEAVRKGYYHNPTEDALIMWVHNLPSIPS